MLKLITYLFIFAFLLACAQVTSLNLKKHQFGQIPTKIIWIQVAGLNEEHIAMLKFSKQTANEDSAIENFLCIGKAWEYNLFEIRPTASASFLSQMTGKKNIKNTCDDYKLRPIWSYMLPKGYVAGVFEGEMQNRHSLQSAYACKDDGKNFIEGVTLWKMGKAYNKDQSKVKLFHTNEMTDFKPSNTYYDKSCSSGECYSTFSQNAVMLYEQFTRKSPNHLFIIRDFNYLDKVNKGNVSEMKNDLLELEKIVQYFQVLAQKSNDVLFLLTSAETKNIEFPRAGNQWNQFESRGKFLKNKKSQLISTVFASGARAENFCGIYDQSDLLSRIFSGAKQQGLELAIINPFQQ